MNSSDSIPERPAPQGDGSDRASEIVTTALTVARPARLVTATSPVATASAAGFAGWLHAFRRRWILALSLSVMGGAIGGTVGWLTWLPEYTSAAALKIASQQPTMFSEGRSGTDQSPFDVYKRTQRELILNQKVLSDALRDDLVKDLPIVTQQVDPVEWLQREIVVSFPGDAEIMQISMRGHDAQATTKLVNAVRKAYLAGVVGEEQNARWKHKDELEKLLRTAEDNVRQARANVTRLTGDLGTGDSRAATMIQQTALTEYATLRTERLTIQLQRMRAEAKEVAQQARVEALESETLPADLLEARIKVHPDFAATADAAEKIRQTLHQAELVVAPGRERLLEDHRGKLATAEQKLDEVRKRLEPSLA